MLDWLKDRWELVLAGLVGIFAFFLGRRNTKATEASLESTEKQIEVLEEISEETEIKKENAQAKYEKEVAKLKKQHKEAKTALEKKMAKRKLELLELAKNDPDAINKLLEEEFNIRRSK